MTVITTTQPRRASTAERARVHRWVRKWLHEFYLDILRINVLFHDYPEDDDSCDGEPQCAARMDADLVTTYHTATLQIFPKFFDDAHEDQEFAICHEMSHLLAVPLTTLVHQLQNGVLVTPKQMHDTDEEVTDRFARIVFYGGSAKHVELPIKVKREPAASRKTRKR